MQVQKTTVESLFTHERRYLIPLFQRPYVWTQADQWEPLWDDVRDVAERELDSLDAGAEQEHRPHFLGAIVLQPRAPHGNHLPVLDVIDGQQRLTTLQLLLRSLRDVAQARGDMATAKWCTARTENANALEDVEVEQHKVWPTQRDQPQFLEVFQAGSRETLEKLYPARVGRRRNVRPVMVEAYLFFHQAIAEWLDEHAASPKAATALRLALQRRFELVQIDLDAGENPQEIFETLNARGVPLLASDLLRNFVFRRAKGPAHSEQLHGKYWARFDEPNDPARPEGLRFWEVETQQGRLSRARLDLYVQHYLAMKLERDVRIGELFREYKLWIEASHPFATLDEELAEFGRYADHFRSLQKREGDADLSRVAAWLDALDTSTAYPVVLWVLGEPSIDVSARGAMFRDLESFLVRRAVCSRSTKQYTRRFLELLRDFKRAATFDRATFHALLAGGAKDSFDWPADDEFESAWNTTDAYRTLKPGRVEMILRAIEQASRSSKSEPITLHGPLTVEHVMPQEWEKHWPLPSDADISEARDRREEVLHDFGNLTLLTQALNSSVSHGPAAEKLPTIAAHSNLELSKWFHGRSSWTEEDIRLRGRALFTKARVLWPGP
ncbi:MAG: DUF262 domain-containing protein [Deltaproteobacteria bacterium]|nr:DUF262 domain-containing protein [Deltaproteobacteria bacterium]